MVCSEEKWHFSTSTHNSRISLCVRAQYLKYVKGTHQSHLKAFSDCYFLYLLEKNNDFAELKVPHIFRKQVPLLHNTVLILSEEGAGLVAVFYQNGSKQFHYQR